MVNFNPIVKSYIVIWQSDLVNLNEIVLRVLDKHYHINKGKLQKGNEIEVLRNYVLLHSVH